MKRILKLGKTLSKFGIKTCLVVLSLFEASIFLLRNRALFKNKVIYVFWTWSFGHTIAGIDYASRLYDPNRISLIYIPHPFSNSFVAHCFSHNVDAYIYQSIIPTSGNLEGSAKYRALRLILLFLGGFTDRYQVIEHSNIYMTLSLAKGPLLAGVESANKLTKANDWTGYVRLLHQGIGRSPRLPKHYETQVRESILTQHPEFFDRPFVTLLLRQKGGSLDSSFRCSGSEENYSPAIQYLVQNGYHVVGSGETDHSKYGHIDGYYPLDEVDTPRGLLSIFLLMKCVLFIGQQSGPHVLPNTCGHLCLICDALPHRLGTFQSGDLVLFKHLITRKDGNQLSLKDIFVRYPDLAYGYQFGAHDIAIEPNSPDEILNATKEAIAIVENRLSLTEEDRLLCDAFRRLPSEGMPIRYHGNRPPLFSLRANKNELLAVLQSNK